jgi:hypothetical protein
MTGSPVRQPPSLDARMRDPTPSATGARPGAPVAHHAGVWRSEVAQGDCHEGGGEPDDQLNHLAPDIAAAFVDEALPPNLTPFDIAVEPPALWEEQRRFST